MTELSMQARRLIDLARDEDEALPGVLRQVEQSLAARIAAGVGVGAIGMTVTKSAVGSAFSVMAGKVAVVSTMVAATAGAGWLISSASSLTQGERETVSDAPLRAPAELRAKAVTGPEPNVVQPIGVLQGRLPSPEASETLALDAKKSRSSAKLTRSPAPPKIESVAEAAPDQLQAETRDLRQAQRALRSGHPAEALTLLDQQDRRFPGGALAQERAAARVLALCLAGRTAEARLGAEHFEQKWPRSPLVARVQSSCKPRGNVP